MHYRNFFDRPKPLAAHGGIKAQSRAGDFGSTWWAKRWQSVLESFRLEGRLARGRTYARTGQVLSINVDTGEVTAKVQGSRPRPYDVHIAVTKLSDGQWRHLIKALSGQARFVAKLLAGEMPKDIEEVFTAAGLSLFPTKRGDLKTDCSCPDQANPCKHIAAVYYLLGEEFDRDPFLLFRLRGLDRDQLLARLGQSAHTPPEPDVVIPAGEALPIDPGSFWKATELPEDFFGEIQASPVAAAVVRRLGKFPFWRGEKPLSESLEPAYIQAGQVGLKVFLGEKIG